MTKVFFLMFSGGIQEGKYIHVSFCDISQVVKVKLQKLIFKQWFIDNLLINMIYSSVTLIILVLLFK